MQILVVDVGGNHVKIIVSGQEMPREFASGPSMTAKEMVAGVKKLAEGWTYQAVSIGYPGPALRGKPVAEPHNLGPGWVGFDFEAAFGCPVKLINDAAMQALGSYQGGRMLFLGLGTGLGSTMIVDGIVEPMELGHLPYKKGTYEDYVGIRGLKRLGKKKWRHYVADVVARLFAALQPEYVVLGGGNVHKLKELPPNCRLGENTHAFLGGYRMWEKTGADRFLATNLSGGWRLSASQPPHSSLLPLRVWLACVHRDGRACSANQTHIKGTPSFARRTSSGARRIPNAHQMQIKRTSNAHQTHSKCIPNEGCIALAANIHPPWAYITDRLPSTGTPPLGYSESKRKREAPLKLSLPMFMEDCFATEKRGGKTLAPTYLFGECWFRILDKECFAKNREWHIPLVGIWQSITPSKFHSPPRKQGIGPTAPTLACAAGYCCFSPFGRRATLRVTTIGSMQPIYLDYNATTPIDPAVVEAMLPFLREYHGNPSSTHLYGQTTHEAIERARTQVAALLGARPDEILFTAGGTEASNHALKGAVFAKWQGQGGAPAIITSAIEHPATLKPCEFLRKLGCKIIILPVDRDGLVDPDAVRRALTPATTIVSIMHANNEVGTLQPIGEIAKIVQDQGALMHTDAAQSLGKVPVNVGELNVDLLSVAGHKLYAPKGVGVLFARRGVFLEPLLHGAGHEGGRRAGTENVPYIVGLGKACEIAGSLLAGAEVKLRGLRERLWAALRVGLGDKIVLNGHPQRRLPNTLNVNFVGHVGADLLRKVPEIAASTGSACHEGRIALSPVLAAMGVSPELGQGAIRLSVGRFTTEEEIDRAAGLLIKAARL